MRLLNCKEVSARIHVSVTTLKLWAKGEGRSTLPEGFPQAIKICNTWRWNDQQLDAWIEAITQPREVEKPKRRPGRPRKFAAVPKKDYFGNVRRLRETQ